MIDKVFIVVLMNNDIYDILSFLLRTATQIRLAIGAQRWNTSFLTDKNGFATGEGAATPETGLATDAEGCSQQLTLIREAAIDE
jgi:hypothetical protein